MQENYTAALAAQQQGDSQAAHRLMQRAYLEAQQWAQESHRTEEIDRATRWFSHQLLLQWSFTEHYILCQQLRMYFSRYVKHVPRYYPQQGLFLQGRDLRKDPLRVGFLSPDLRNCSAARLIADLFAYAPANIQAFVYATYPHDLSHDEVFQTLYAYMVNERKAPWHDGSKETQHALAQRIYHDRIDILIDLAGHTSLSNLRVMAHQPAPIQLSGLTFNGGIALGNRCLRATDAICTPTSDYYPHDLPLMLPVWISQAGAATSSSQHPEKTTDETANKTADETTEIGCAHHPGRLSDTCLNTWGKLLQQAPQSRLHLKHAAYAPNTRQRIQAHLIQAGAQPEQILFSGHSDYETYLHFYDSLALALDPFPYHGGLVSCDALWRGVPLITLSEGMHGGASLLHQLGFSAGIATTPTDYIQKALQLLKNSLLRSQWRERLPQKMQQTVIGNPEHWVAQIFNALAAYIYD